MCAAHTPRRYINCAEYTPLAQRIGTSLSDGCCATSELPLGAGVPAPPTGSVTAPLADVAADDENWQHCAGLMWWFATGSSRYRRLALHMLIGSQ